MAPLSRGYGRGGSPFPLMRLVLGVCLATGVLFWLYLHNRASHATLTTLTKQIEQLQSALQDHAREAQEASREEEHHVHGHISEVLSSLPLQHSKENVTAKLQQLNLAVQRLESKDAEHAAFHRDKVDTLLHRHIRPVVTPLDLKLDEKDVMELPPARGVTKNGDGGESPSTLLLIIASTRAPYLQRCLASVVQYHPGAGIPVLISEDGNTPEVRRVVDEARTAFLAHLPSRVKEGEHTHLRFDHVRFPSPPQLNYENGYFRLAAHFKWALQQAFEDSAIKRVVLLEEDLQIAPDFFELFLSLAKMLDDPQENLLCVSAFNDNGQAGHVKDPERLYRSDFFPGLGWMLNRALWEELEPKWPRAYWDDWLREPKNRKGRHIIRPEVSRTYHYGRQGVSNSEFGDFLGGIVLHNSFVKFSSLPLDYLSKDTWDRDYLVTVQRATAISPAQLQSVMQLSRGTDGQGAARYPHGVRLHYDNFDEFARLATSAGLMDNIKANVPRTAYRGIVTAWLGGTVVVHIAPSPQFARQLEGGLH